jgi:soluble lytic murein transglycosylase-like protein
MTLDTGDARQARTHRSVPVLATLRLGRALPALLALLTCTSTASASCWEAAGARHGVHPWLLAAIATVESGLNPRAVNRSHESRTGSVDLGLMQINSRWLPVLARYGITREGLFEPCTSVMVGAWILADLFARHGTTWEAVGAYNAACTQLTREACTARRNAYAAKVHAELPIRLARGTREASPPTAQTLPVRARPAGILAVRVGSPDRDTDPGEPRVGQLPAENRDG